MMGISHTFEIVDALMAVLDEEHAHAVVDHRRAIKRPMTLHAARLLAKQFARCEDPNEAADEMILRGWQAFKPEWIRDRNMQRRPNYAESARSIINGSEGLFGSGHDVQLVSGRIGRH